MPATATRPKKRGNPNWGYVPHNDDAFEKRLKTNKIFAETTTQLCSNCANAQMSSSTGQCMVRQDMEGMLLRIYRKNAKGCSSWKPRDR